MGKHDSRDFLAGVPHQRQFVIPPSQSHHDPYPPSHCCSYIQDEDTKNSEHNDEIEGANVLLLNWVRKEMQRGPGKRRNNPYESDIAECYSPKEKQRLQTMKAHKAILSSKEQHEQSRPPEQAIAEASQNSWSGRKALDSLFSRSSHCQVRSAWLRRHRLIFSKQT